MLTTVLLPHRYDDVHRRYNISPEVKAQMYKLASITLCANTHGQVGVGLMVNRPQPGDASYEIFAEERDGILGALKRRSIKITKALQELEGVTCNPSEGALYAFPQITLPPGAVAAAEYVCETSFLSPSTFLFCPFFLFRFWRCICFSLSLSLCLSLYLSLSLSLPSFFFR